MCSVCFCIYVFNVDNNLSIPAIRHCPKWMFKYNSHIIYTVQSIFFSFPFFISWETMFSIKYANFGFLSRKTNGWLIGFFLRRRRLRLTFFLLRIITNFAGNSVNWSKWRSVWNANIQARLVCEQVSSYNSQNVTLLNLRFSVQFRFFFLDFKFSFTLLKIMRLYICALLNYFSLICCSPISGIRSIDVYNMFSNKTHF